MAFYKLFYIIHRRTDWVKLWRFERQCIMPEWYEERERETKITLNKLAFVNAIVNSLDSHYQMYN